VKIFKERDFLLSENTILIGQVAALEGLSVEQNFVIQSQSRQIGTLNEIIVKKDAALMNCDAMIENLKKQIASEQSGRKKYLLYGAGGGIAMACTLILIFK